jgi:hypothetical protein
MEEITSCNPSHHDCSKNPCSSAHRLCSLLVRPCMAVTYVLFALWFMLLLGPERVLWLVQNTADIQKILWLVSMVLLPVGLVTVSKPRDLMRQWASSVAKDNLAPWTMLALTLPVVAVFVHGRLLLTSGLAPDFCAMIRVSREWSPDNIDRRFNTFERGRMAASGQSQVYRTYVLSRVLRQCGTGVLSPSDEETLDNATHVGGPLFFRMLGHLGMANVAIGMKRSDIVRLELQQTRLLCLTMSPHELRRTVLSEVANTYQIAGTKEDRPAVQRELFELSLGCLDEVKSLSSSTADDVALANRRGLVLKLLSRDEEAWNQWTSAIKVYEDETRADEKRRAGRYASSAYCNKGFLLLCKSSILDALQMENKALQISEEADRKNIYRYMLLCYVLKGNRREASRVAGLLESSSAASLNKYDYALIGLAHLDASSAGYYERALGYPHRPNRRLCYREFQELARICHREEPELPFAPVLFMQCVRTHSG